MDLAPIDIALDLTGVGPDGYRIHFSTSGASQESSVGEDRKHAQSHVLTKSRYVRGVSENRRKMWFGARDELSPGIGERWLME